MMGDDVHSQINRLVVDITGSWGKWQWKIFIFCMITGISSSWHGLLTYFVAPDINYWCVEPLPNIESNVTMKDQCVVNNVLCSKWKYEVGREYLYQSTIISEVSSINLHLKCKNTTNFQLYNL